MLAMNHNTNLLDAELLRQVGFESRTLLNGITGPIQLLRSMSNDPALIETIHILDLSTIRFEKFSLRAQLMADLLNPDINLTTESCDLSDLAKHAILELNDFINFFNIQIHVDFNIPPVVVYANKDFVYQSVMIIFEQFMGVLENGSTINVSYVPEQIQISAEDNGFFADKFQQPSNSWSNDIDIILLQNTFSAFKIFLSVDKADGKSVLTIGKSC